MEIFSQDLEGSYDLRDPLLCELSEVGPGFEVPYQCL